jgi:hypothetical protein
LSEFGVDNRRKGSVDKSLAAYKDALNVAAAELPPTHPMRLGLALNFSVFCYEILESHERAVHVAQQAFDDALAGLDDLSETDYKDSTLIMQLLRDNFTLWKSDKEGMFHICDISGFDWFTGKLTDETESKHGENDSGENSNLIKDIPASEGDESMFHISDPTLRTFTGMTDSENEEDNDKNSSVKPSEDVL